MFPSSMNRIADQGEGIKQIAEGSYGKIRQKENIVVKQMKIGYKEVDPVSSEEYFTLEPCNIREVCFLSQYSHPLINSIKGIDLRIIKEEEEEEENRKPLYEESKNLIDLYMEYGGTSLYNYRMKEPIQELDLKYICYQLLVLFSQLEEFNFVHGDINHTNVLIDEQTLKITVIDWGLMDFFPKYNQDKRGVEGFHPPELILKGKHSPKSDIFSLGSLLLFCSTKIWLEEEDILPNYESKTEIKQLEQIKDPQIKEIISYMLKLNVNDRKFASELLEFPFFQEYKIKETNYNSFQIKEVERIRFSSYFLSLEKRKELITWIYKKLKDYDLLYTFTLTCYFLDVYLSKCPSSFYESRLDVIMASCAYLADLIMTHHGSESDHYTSFGKEVNLSADEMVEQTLLLLQSLNFVVYKSRFDHSLVKPNYELILLLVADPKGFGKEESYFLNEYNKLNV